MKHGDIRVVRHRHASTMQPLPPGGLVKLDCTEQREYGIMLRTLDGQKISYEEPELVAKFTRPYWLAQGDVLTQDTKMFDEVVVEHILISLPSARLMVKYREVGSQSNATLPAFRAGEKFTHQYYLTGLCRQ